MDIALERIANMRDGRLVLSNLGLTELPPRFFEEKLPSTLTHLNCIGNQLTELPQLPSTLIGLYCENNPIQYPPADVMKEPINYIREWMSENPLTFVKSANKV